MGGLAFWVSPYTPYKAPSPPPHCPNASVLSVSAERCLFLGCQSSPSEQRLLSTFPIFTSIFSPTVWRKTCKTNNTAIFLSHEHLHCDTCWTCAMGLPLARRQRLQHAPHHFPGKKVQNLSTSSPLHTH
ncbi:hypothetical protein PDJAM_G00183680 [Pangasius djambal]|uniref:Uncharacterized protein n=1 Tax=Pangasius djambal TaxID=1691987 RepID=A0ACC5Y3R9_9TELE|nr:hypothetical protein [Pangasius djambal]